METRQVTLMAGRQDAYPTSLCPSAVHACCLHSTYKLFGGREDANFYPLVTVGLLRTPLSDLCTRFQIIYLIPVVDPTSAEFLDCLEAYLIFRLCLLRIS